MEAVLPQSVQRELDNANAIQEQIAASQAQVEVQTVDAVNPVPVAEPVVETVVQSAPSEQVADTPKLDVWEQKYRSLQGKFDAEIPRLQRAVQEREHQLQQLAAEREQETRRKQVEVEQKPLVTKEDADNFGEDMIDFVRRTVREEFSRLAPAVMQDIRSELSVVKQKVNAVSEQTERSAIDTFWGQVTHLVPDWVEIDVNPEWIAWLDSSPAYTTETYRELASKAISAGDATRIARLVDVWHKETGVAAQPQVTRQQTAQAELARQVTPSTAKSGNAPAATERVWTQAEYAEAYDPRNAGKMSMTEWAALMAEADKAVAEGRLR